MQAPVGRAARKGGGEAGVAVEREARERGHRGEDGRKLLQRVVRDSELLEPFEAPEVAWEDSQPAACGAEARQRGEAPEVRGERAQAGVVREAEVRDRRERQQRLGDAACPISTG